MKFGKVIESSTGNGFSIKVELSDPPIYSADRHSISSKDGMLWVPVAPHAAAGCAVGSFGTTFTATACCPHFGGAAPAPGPYVIAKFNGSSSQQ